VVEEVAE
jgi:hypothetical protein